MTEGDNMEHLDPDGPISMAPIMVDARADGMVIVSLDGSAVVGTWMDALKLSYTLLSAARSASLSIDVAKNTFEHCLIKTVVQSSLENYDNWE
jgi:hypothetical protein